MDYTWDARGVSFGFTMTPHGMQQMRTRLNGAQEAFEKAHHLDPDRPQPSSRMLAVATGLAFKRKDMEVWFARAMQADPDWTPAYRAKLNWLQTKWYGDQKDCMVFAEQCKYTVNWYAGLPLVGEHPDPDQAPNSDEDYKTYYSYGWYWNQAEYLYRTHLEHYPTDRNARTRFAMIAARAGNWATAAQQFDRLGEKPWPGYFRSRDDFENLRDEARRQSKFHTQSR